MNSKARSRAARPSRRSAARGRAFTLTELLVVVVLLGLVATSVTVSLGGATDTARLRAATLQIEQTLRLARHRARTHHAPAWMQFQLGSGEYRIALAEASMEPGPVWKTLDGVKVLRAMPSIAASGRQAQLLAIRVTPGGATLPWALELQAATARRVVWTDGVTSRVAFRDGLTLDQFGGLSGAEKRP